MGIAEKIYEKLKDAPEPLARKVMEFLETLELEESPPLTRPKPKRSMKDYEGCLKDSKAFEGDPLEIQRKLRAEWDREWDE